MSMQLDMFKHAKSTTVRSLMPQKTKYTEQIDGRFLTVGYAFATLDDLFQFRESVEPDLLDRCNGVCVHTPNAIEEE